MTETKYQGTLIKKIKALLPGAVVLKNDSGYMQGVPDLTVLFNDRWAMLEVKVSADANEQPNQRHHVGHMDDMSFAAFIYPENEQEVLHDLQLALGGSR